MPADTLLIDDTAAAPILELYSRGQYLQAWRQAEQLGPLVQWRGVTGRILAGRLAGMVGHDQLSRVLYYRAWREHPETSRALYYHARRIYSNRGLYLARELLQRHADLIHSDAQSLPNWLALQARIEAGYRDFSRADRLIEQALELDPEDPWLRFEHAAILEAEDRYSEALQVATRTLESRPYYRPAVQQAAYLLQLLGRDAEALQLLRDTAQQLESYHVVAQLLGLLIELEQYAEAATLLPEIERLSPLPDREQRRWLAGRRSDLAYQLGDIATAIAQAEQSGNHYFQQIAKNLREASHHQQLRLPIPFLRQHYNTCGPAIMSVIATYLGRPVDQQSIVDSIWYSGTTDHSERRWAEEQGWLAREFRLDWDSAVLLLDQGLPLMVTTVEADSAHLQAVIGYDAARRILFIRDPYARNYQEFLAEPFFERYADSGPRAMVFIPDAQRETVPVQVLPECEQYDRYYALQDALYRHARDSAGALLQHMQQTWPGARLTLFASRRLADYDANDSGALEANQALLKLYPDSARLQLYMNASLGILRRLVERRAWLTQLVQQADAHALLRLEYARLLAEDARCSPQTRRQLHDVLRVLPTKAQAYYILAGLYWDERRHEDATELYRIAASLEYTDEHYALDYFKAARFVRRGSEVLYWLQQRHARLIRHSSKPATTLYQAYALLDRETEGLAVLEQAIAQRGDDGDLKLFLAKTLIQLGRYTRAADWLEQARGQVHQSEWLAQRARLDEYTGQIPAALANWQALTALEPQNITAHRSVAQLLARTSGKAAAIEYAARLAEALPHNHESYELWLDWLDTAPATEYEQVLRKLIDTHPTYAWAYRQLAQHLGQQARFDAAFDALQIAGDLEPSSPAYHVVRGDLYRKTARFDAAREAYRDAVSISVDTSAAFTGLLECARSSAAKRDELAFLHRELVRQVTHGDGLLAFQRAAQGLLDNEELAAILQEALDARPDLWSAWSAGIVQHAETGQLQQAEQLAREATARFPLLPVLWLNLAQTLRLQGKLDEEQLALQEALAINPDYSRAIRELAENHEYRGDYTGACEVLRHALTRNPLDAYLHGFLAHDLWKLGQPQQALQHILEAVELATDYHWAWNRLAEWSAETGQAELAETTLRRLLSRQPGDSLLWVTLARHCQSKTEALQACDRAIELDPANHDAYEEKLKLLAEQGEYAPALDWLDSLGKADLPVAIRVYEPWLHYRQGDTDAAIDMLGNLLQDEAHYAEGWRMLAAWAETCEKPAIELEAARQFAGLRPNDAVALTYLADASLRNAQRQEAKTHYARALTLQPDYHYPGLSLFDLHLEDAELDAAAGVLQHLHTHVHEADTRPYVSVRAIQIAARQGRREDALRDFEHLCNSDDTNNWLFDTTTAALREAGWDDALWSLLDARVRDPATLNPTAARVWTDHQKESGEWEIAPASLIWLLEQGETGVQIVDAWLDDLYARENFHSLDRITRKCRKPLRAHDATWATIGYIYTNRDKLKECIAWMRDWQQRGVTPGWALNALAHAYRRTGNFRAAFMVARHGLEQPADSATNVLRVWVGLEYGIAGEPQRLSELYATIQEDEFSAFSRYAHALLTILQDFYQLPPEQRHSAVHSFRDRLRAARHAFPWHWDEIMIRYHLRSCYAIARQLGPFPAALYWCLRLL